MSFAKRARAGCAIAILASLSGALGCSDQACIQKSSLSGDACPTQTQANQLLTNGCNEVSNSARVQSVDSDPSENGDLCCYEVTYFTQGIEACLPTRSGDGGAGI